MRSEHWPWGGSASRSRSPGQRGLPVAGVVLMEEMGGGEGDDPKADDQGADGEDPAASGAIMGGEACGFTDTEDLSADTNGHEKGAEDEREPGHGVPLYPIWSGCGKRQSGRPGSKVLGIHRRGVEQPRRQPMKAMQRAAVGLGLAVMMAGAQAGWAQQGAPAAKPAGTQAQTPEENPNNVAVEPVGHLFGEDRSNLKDYWATVESRTKDSWKAVFPAAARPPRAQGGVVKIEAVVHTDGRVTNMVLEQPSGKVQLDRAAWAAITRSVPYAAFPYGISVDEAKVRFTFSYNGGAGSAVPVGHAAAPIGRPNNTPR